MARTYQFMVGDAEAGLRLDQYLARRLPNTISRAMIQRAIRDGRIGIGDRQIKAHSKLHVGDVVHAQFEFLAPRGLDTILTPQEIPLEIVYEDAHLLVVNKPPGLVTHPAPGHWDGTLVNALLWHLQHGQGARDKGQGKTGFSVPRAPCPVPPLVRAGIVHRLDKDTSGLLLVAKTESAHAVLSKQLKTRTMHRRYVALVEGHLPLNTGTVNAPLGRHLTHRKVMTVRHLGGRSAVTHYRILKRLITSSGFAYTAVDVALETGRTHQIRVHLAHLGYPVLGDTTYGRLPSSFWQSMGIARQLLHAYQLDFQHPATRKAMTVVGLAPEDITRWFDIETTQRFNALIQHVAR